MRDAAAHEERRTKKVRDWLLAILRFAVTLEQADRTTVSVMAREMDGSGSGDQTAFAFFVRTSSKFCNAIANKDEPKRVATLRHYLRRVYDHRLQRALEAAIEFEQAGDG